MYFLTEIYSRYKKNHWSYNTFTELYYLKCYLSSLARRRPLWNVANSFIITIMMADGTRKYKCTQQVSFIGMHTLIWNTSFYIQNIQLDTVYMIYKSQRKYLWMLRLIVNLKQENNSNAHRATKSTNLREYPCTHDGKVPLCPLCSLRR